jgi:phage/plasmid-like protein (TIGR03299 family)
MSRETLNWLNNNVLVGFTEQRGNAWHYRQGSDNHYTGPVPIEDVRKRLFDWEAVESPVLLGETVTDADGDSTVTLPGPVLPAYKAISHSKTGRVFQIAKQGWTPHNYDEWLLTNVEHMLDDDLQIGTAGLLRGGGQAWVQIEVPETMEFAGGLKARPFLLAYTSLDGSLATTYGGSVTSTVCDNTLTIASGQHGGFRHKVRHSSKSLGRIQDVREALGIVHTFADEFGKQVEELLNQHITDRQFDKLVADMVPFPEDPKKAMGAYNAAVKKRQHLTDMYRFDVRAASWRGTAFGAWAAFNTFDQHETKLRAETNRVERNARRMLEGQQRNLDATILDKIVELAA